MGFKVQRGRTPTIGWAETPRKPRPGPLARLIGATLGGATVVAGAVIAPLPGPFGVPVMALGTAMILKNSRRARRWFVKAQRKHPRKLTPIRRIMKRPQAVVSVSWLQALRLERLIRPRDGRVLKRTRQDLRRRWRPRRSPA